VGKINNAMKAKNIYTNEKKKIISKKSLLKNEKTKLKTLLNLKKKV